MPVTAKLSRKFYERLGDDIAGELVDWFNAVDATYQTQLREMNDLNWERFRAELNSLRAEIRAEIRTEISQLRVEMAQLRGDVMKWMFVYWTGSMAAQAALMWAILSR